MVESHPRISLFDYDVLIQALNSNLRDFDLGLRGGRPAWSTAVGLGPIPYRFAGSNPAPRTIFTNLTKFPLFWKKWVINSMI